MKQTKRGITTSQQRDGGEKQRSAGQQQGGEGRFMAKKKSDVQRGHTLRCRSCGGLMTGDFNGKSRKAKPANLKIGKDEAKLNDTTPDFIRPRLGEKTQPHLD